MTHDPKTGVEIKLTDSQLGSFYSGWGAVQECVYRMASAKGFWPATTPNPILTLLNRLIDKESNLTAEERDALTRWVTERARRNVAEMLMLMVTELAEGCEGDRHGNPPSDKIPRFSALEEELADCIIRIMDMAGGLDLRVAQAIVAKIDYNANRPHKHGKEY